jgi:gliding motility-associated-like protein
MRFLKNIIFIIIVAAAMPTQGFSQCMTLSEPLFLQAPDSLCADKKDLIIKASRVNETGAKYLWRTPLKDTITTDSVLRIVRPSAIYSGDYSVAILVDTCQSKFFGPINVQIVGVQKTNADTVKTVVTCNSSEITVMSSYKTNANIFGQWLGTEGVSFDKPNAATTVVKGLKEGDNMVFWLLSTSVCPFFIKDTFNIRREVKPVLQTDEMRLKVGEESATLNLGQVAGSNLNILKDVLVTITKQPRNGTLELLSDGKRLKYNRSSSFQGRDAFELKVCNLKCPNLCSAPIPYTIDVFFDERYPKVTMPKLLAPKSGGEAQLFSIEKLEDYPENELIILNRWGSKQAAFTNYKNTMAWDGMKDGRLLPSGAYYYSFQAIDPKGKPLKALTSVFYIVY